MSQAVDAFRNSFKIPELKSRIIYTLVIIAIYRLGAHIPTPGVNGSVLAEQLGQMTGALAFYDMFSGGAFANATIFALGIMPYITASIIFSLLVPVVPALERLQKEGQEGQKKITEYTRYATIALCVVQSIGIGILLVSLNTPQAQIVPNPGPFFFFMCIISFTTGTAFIMWLGERISENGIGNGMSVIIFISIVTGMPTAFIDTLRLFNAGQLSMFTLGILAIMMCGVIAGSILVTTAQRRIPVQYPRQVKGRKVFGGQRNYLPLRVNQAGVIPIIFASSLLMLPTMLAGYINIEFVQTFFTDYFSMNGVIYNAFYAILIIFFSFFYTAITFNPIEMADNLKKSGSVIMGVRPGKATADYLNRVMTRVTFVGALFLAGVALLPNILYNQLDIQNYNILQFFGGTSLLILVGVGLDTIRQMEQHLVMRHYEGFAKGRRIRGRRT